MDFGIGFDSSKLKAWGYVVKIVFSILLELEISIMPVAMQSPLLILPLFPLSKNTMRF
jgi:hypothetical protein